MWLIYFPREGYDGFVVDEFYYNRDIPAIRPFRFEFWWDKIANCVTVDMKKYGYRWVNEQDIINFPVMHDENLTARKRKFSDIEENG